MLINKSSLASLAGVCAVFPAISLAQGSDYQLAQLDPVVVTATLGPRTVGESLSSTTVIDEEYLRKTQPREFSQVLRSQPGIDVSGNGSYGKETSVSIRGADSGGTVLLVDGIRLRSATTGGATWQYVPSSLLERVEIVRGPRSNLYGADAVGGVVQAFTQRADEEPEAWVEAGAGNLNTSQYSAGASGREGNTRYSVGASHLETDGARLFEDGEERGLRQTSALASVGHQFNNGIDIGLLLMRAEGNSEFGRERDNTDFAVQTAGLNLKVPVTSYWLSELKLAESRDESEAFGGSPAVFDTRTRSANWQNRLFFGRHELVLGTEYLVDEVESTTSYDEDSRDNAAAFTQLLLDLGRSDLQFSLRNDENEAYGSETTGGAAYGYQLDDSHRVRLNVGTSFKAPSFNELYFPGFGNPDLEPERAKSLEAGIRGQYTDWFWDLAVYQSEVEDLSITDGTQAQSVPEARLRGVELSTGTELRDWQLRGAATVSDPENRATGDLLTRRAAQTLRLDADRDLGRWSVGGSLIGRSHSYDSEGEQDRIAGHMTADIRASWRFAQNWTTKLTAENLLDKKYVTAGSNDQRYLTAGRTVFLSVRYDIQ